MLTVGGNARGSLGHLSGGAEKTLYSSSVCGGCIISSLKYVSEQPLYSWLRINLPVINYPLIVYNY